MNWSAPPSKQLGPASGPVAAPAAERPNARPNAAAGGAWLAEVRGIGGGGKECPGWHEATQVLSVPAFCFFLYEIYL